MSSKAAPLSLVQQLQRELEDQRKETKALRSEIVRIRDHPPKPSTSDEDCAKKFDKLSIFDGGADPLREWLPALRKALRAKDLMGKDAFIYIWSHLGKKSKTRAKGIRFAAQANDKWDPEVLLSFLDFQEKGPAARDKAVNNLFDFKQESDEALSTYVVQFEEDLADAGASSWPDAVRVTILHRGLKPSVRRWIYKWCDAPLGLLYEEYKKLLPLDVYDRRISESSRTDGQKMTRQPTFVHPLGLAAPLPMGKVSYVDANGDELPDPSPKDDYDSTNDDAILNAYFSWLDREGILEDVLSAFDMRVWGFKGKAAK